MVLVCVGMALVLFWYCLSVLLVYFVMFWSKCLYGFGIALVFSWYGVGIVLVLIWHCFDMALVWFGIVL